MNILSPISSIMSPNPVCIGADETLAIAGKMFSENHINHLPVIAEGKLVGMISKSDFLFFRRGFIDSPLEKIVDDVRLHNYHARDIMTTKLAKLDPTDKINVALDVFKENLFHALPIVDGDKILGIVTTYDIIKRLALDNVAVAEYENL